jgi:hypothetical protein
MLTVNLFDEIFRHTVTSANIPPIHLAWIRDQRQWKGTTIFTDDYVNAPIVLQVNCKNKLLWLVESREITSTAHTMAPRFQDRFEKILTHDRHLLESHPDKFIFAICASQRELQQDKIPTGVFPKSKMLSTIASSKRQTIGHRFRHEVIKVFRSSMDVFGREYNPIPSVSFALKDYRFSLTIENACYDYNFTEKILNCFYMGTVPIYWGCPSIGKFFDMDGIISFQTLGELQTILQNLTREDYERRLPAIHKNYELAQNYLSAEEWIFNNLRHLLHE